MKPEKDNLLGKMLEDFQKHCVKAPKGVDLDYLFSGSRDYSGDYSGGEKSKDKTISIQ
ncbi:MAG: hypothetical protein ABH950_05870 [Candidatus Altiarchaeota archaeon]